jgi:hypothetical protein
MTVLEKRHRPGELAKRQDLNLVGQRDQAGAEDVLLVGR